MKIPQSILTASCAMFSPYLEITPIQLEKALKKPIQPPSLQSGLRVGDFAEIMGVTKMTVWTWEKEGRIQLSRIGRTVRVPRSEAERIINGDF